MAERFVNGTSEVMLRISEVRQEGSEVALKSASEVMLRISEVRRKNSEVALMQVKSAIK